MTNIKDLLTSVEACYTDMPMHRRVLTTRVQLEKELGLQS